MPYTVHTHKPRALSPPQISHWRFPECSLKDKILHLFFVFCVFVMIACAAVTIICFKEVSHSHHHSQLHQGHQQTAVGHQQQQEMRMKEKLVKGHRSDRKLVL